jgi:hypothetical protein
MHLASVGGDPFAVMAKFAASDLPHQSVPSMGRPNPTREQDLQLAVISVGDQVINPLTKPFILRWL